MRKFIEWQPFCYLKSINFLLTAVRCCTHRLSTTSQQHWLHSWTFLLLASLASEFIVFVWEKATFTWPQTRLLSEEKSVQVRKRFQVTTHHLNWPTSEEGKKGLKNCCQMLSHETSNRFESMASLLFDENAWIWKLGLNVMNRRVNDGQKRAVFLGEEGVTDSWLSAWWLTSVIHPFSHLLLRRLTPWWVASGRRCDLEDTRTCLLQDVENWEAELKQSVAKEQALEAVLNVKEWIIRIGSEILKSGRKQLHDHCSHCLLAAWRGKEGVRLTGKTFWTSLKRSFASFSPEDLCVHAWSLALWHDQQQRLTCHECCMMVTMIEQVVACFWTALLQVHQV